MEKHRKIITKLIEILFPPRCLGCDEILYPYTLAQGFCSKCQKEVKKVGDLFCVKCGKKLLDGRNSVCADCKKKQHYFTQNRVVYVYKGPLKQAMYRLKYSNRRGYAKYFAQEMIREYGEWIEKIEPDVIVPIPMYKPKERKRGYNQAAVLAKELHKITGLPLETDMVVRVKNSRPQKELNDTERKNNLKNAFKIRKSGVKCKKILLIDDIYTTGATMDAVSGVLLSGGIAEVYCLSVCGGEGE